MASPAAGEVPIHPGWDRTPFGIKVPWGPFTGCLTSTQNKIRREPRGQNHEAAVRLARRRQPRPQDWPRQSRLGARPSGALRPQPPPLPKHPFQVSLCGHATHVCLGEGDPSWNGVKPSPRVLQKPSGQPKHSCSVFRQRLTTRDVLRHPAVSGGGPGQCVRPHSPGRKLQSAA